MDPAGACLLRLHVFQPVGIDAAPPDARIEDGVTAPH
jgi:hypothetical protein